MNKKTLILLCAGLLTSSALARYELWFDDPFDLDWDDIMEAHDKAMNSMNRLSTPSKEAQEAVKAARKSLSQITHEIKEDDEKTTIIFSGFENLSKEDVKVVKKGNGWFGTITTPAGRVEFFISPEGLQVTSKLEVMKEETQDKDDKKSSHMFYSSSSVTQSQSFASLVDVTTLKAEPVKPDTFAMTVDKQKEVVLAIS